MADNINHPPRYTQYPPGYEPIQVIEAWGLGFCLGTVLKYIARKGDEFKPHNQVEDLEKAQWYLAREIARLKEKTKEPDTEIPIKYKLEPIYHRPTRLPFEKT